VEFISPGARTLLRRARAAAAKRATHPSDLIALADRYASPFQPELIPELVNTYGVRSQPPGTIGDRAT
jgi:hypothetical protein